MGKLPKEAQGRGSVCQWGGGAQMDKAFEHQAVAFAHTVYIAWVEGSSPARKEKVQIGLNEGCLAECRQWAVFWNTLNSLGLKW